MKENQPDTEKGQINFVTLEDFRGYIRESLEAKVRTLGIEFVQNLLEEEIDALCGPKGSHKRKQGLAHRGGSERGWVVLNNQRVAIRRPRARNDAGEIPLDRYEALQSMDNLGDFVSRMMLHGISTRAYDQVIDKFDNDLGLSKSTVSREFIKASRTALNELNSRRFEDELFWAIVMDGTEFGGSTLIVALGVDITGKKHVLGVSEGATENSELCLSLLRNLQDRNIQFTDKLLAVVDGSKALRKSLTDSFGDRVEIQRCLIHKRGNVESKLDKMHHAELKRRMDQAFNENRFEFAEKSFQNTIKWLEAINLTAAHSLEEGMPDLLTLHRIGMPPELRKSFYTTNLIESAFSPVKERSRRVKKWNHRTDQVLRWSSTLLLYQDTKFRKVRGVKHIQDFLMKFVPEKENSLAREIAV